MSIVIKLSVLITLTLRITLIHAGQGYHSSSICNLPKAVGVCKSYLPRYFYNKLTGKCEQFIYGGCQGNKNNFVLLEECQAECLPQLKGQVYNSRLRANYIPHSVNSIYPIEKPHDDIQFLSRCHHDKLVGPCKLFETRYYYDTIVNKCIPFKYGGCRGNLNNFRSYDQCQHHCIEKAQPYPNKFICTQRKDRGSCRGFEYRFYYNAATGSCEEFIYGGCGGNENNFYTRSECNAICHPPVHPPIYPPALPLLPPFIPSTSHLQINSPLREPEKLFDEAYYPLNPTSPRPFHHSFLPFRRFLSSDPTPSRPFHHSFPPFGRFFPSDPIPPRPLYNSLLPPFGRFFPSDPIPSRPLYNSLSSSRRFFPSDPIPSRPPLYNSLSSSRRFFPSDPIPSRPLYNSLSSTRRYFPSDPTPSRSLYNPFSPSQSFFPSFTTSRFNPRETFSPYNSASTSTDLCSLPKDPGYCYEEPVTRYYYDKVDNICKEFSFRCGGNANNFKDYSECLSACVVIIEPPFVSGGSNFGYQPNDLYSKQAVSKSNAEELSELKVNSENDFSEKIENDVEDLDEEEEESTNDSEVEDDEEPIEEKNDLKSM